MADLQALASQVRRDILRMVHAVSSGHPGGSLGCADLLTYLYNFSTPRIYYNLVKSRANHKISYNYMMDILINFQYNL